MIRTFFAAGLAGAGALAWVPPAQGHSADIVSAQPEPAADPLDEDLLSGDGFTEANVEDVLVSDDSSDSDDFEDFSDDAVDVETGNDAIGDVYELFDEDGDPAFDEDEDENRTNPGHDAGLFFDELPLLRKPPGDSAALDRPGPSLAGAIADEAAWLKFHPGIAVVAPFGGKLAGKFVSAPVSAPRWRHALAPPPHPAAAALQLAGAISGAFNLSAGASAVYLVKDGGAPFQAQLNYATNPATWQPAQNYRKYAAMPGWEARHICGGSLIEPDWVLTAAHCLWMDASTSPEAKLARGVNVLLGAENIARPKTGMTYRVDRVVIHGGFHPSNIYRNDIALVHLVSGGNTSRVNQISSIRRNTGGEPADRTPVSVTGWGKTMELESQLATTALWRADVKLIAATRCRTLPNLGQVTDRSGHRIEKIGAGSLCAGESRGKACSGDSGGPLVFTDGAPRLVGITSWTRAESCGKPEIPNVYTNVGAYDGWIRRAMAAPPQPGGVTYFQ